MNKKLLKPLTTAIVFCLTVVILIFPSQCLLFACNGLNLWFQKMIPALFPFMVLSGIMIQMNLTDAFVQVVKPFLNPLFHVSSNCLYAMVIGFLCGFPMGAHVTSQLYERNRISRTEASFLLAFCNNIGPVYFISFAIPTIGVKALAPALFGMYGLPLLYGLVLRYSVYRSAFIRMPVENQGMDIPASFLCALDESVMTALHGITRLGGYMIFFNLLNIIPFLLIHNKEIQSLISCLFEITGGIQTVGTTNPFFVLCLLPFGGFSCIAQTYSMIRNTDLSLKEYIIHKVILAAISFLYYSFLL